MVTGRTTDETALSQALQTGQSAVNFTTLPLALDDW